MTLSAEHKVRMLAFVVVCYYFLLFVDIMVPLSAVPSVRFQASSAQFVTMLAFLVNSLSLWTLQYYSKANALFKLWPLCLVSLSHPVCKEPSRVQKEMASQKHWQPGLRQELSSVISYIQKSLLVSSSNSYLDLCLLLSPVFVLFAKPLEGSSRKLASWKHWQLELRQELSFVISYRKACSSYH